MPKVGPKVRIHFAPAGSLRTIGPSAAGTGANSLRIAPRETSGTEGSNPSSSSGESSANLISSI
jgi:hypothetical protein